MSVQDSALILAWLAILILTLAVTGVIRQMRLLVSGSPSYWERGTQGTSNNIRIGTQVDVPWMSAAEVRLVVFLDSDCSACVEIAPALARAANMLHRRTPPVDMISIFRGDSRDVGSGHTIPRRADIFDLYGVGVTPSAVVETRRSGVVRASLLGDANSVEALSVWAATTAEVESPERTDGHLVDMDSATQGSEIWT